MAIKKGKLKSMFLNEDSENALIHIMDFLNFVSKLVEDPPFIKAKKGVSIQLLELKMHSKILSLFNSKYLGKFKEKIFEICFQILHKQQPSMKLIRPTLTKHHKLRKATNDVKLIDDIRDAQRDDMNSNKATSNRVIGSIPGSPVKTEQSEDNRNQGYFQLNQLKSVVQLKVEKEARADVIGLIFVNLAWIKVELERQDIGRTSSQIPFEYDLVEILETLRSKFKDNNLVINMSPEEVAKVMNTLDFNSHMTFMELLFPVLSLDTQFALISRFKFKYSSHDPLGEGVNLNIFEFLKGIGRKEIRSFMTKIQCSLLLLNFIQWKLEDELSKEVESPSDSYSLELFYLFNDFLNRDYSGVFIDGRITRKCNNGCAGNNNSAKVRKKTDNSNYSDLHSAKASEFNERYCHECFGRNNWHEISLDIIKIFVTIFKNVPYNTPCVHIDIDEKDIISHLVDKEDIKEFRMTPIRNGGIMRLLFQSILILMKGSVAIKLRETTYAAAICESSDIIKPQGFQFSKKLQLSPLKIDVLKAEASINNKDESEYDISYLIDLLEYLCFPSRSSFNGKELSKKSSDAIPADITQFYLSPSNFVEFSDEIKEQKKYFKTEDCKSNCFFHDSVKVRSNIINEILLIFSSTVQYSRTLKFDHVNDFSVLPEETVLKI